MITEKSLYKLRILYILLKYGDLSISNLARKSGIRFNTVKEEVEELERDGLVEILESKRVKIVKINLTNRKVIILRNLIEELEDI
ncbi:winged helix-turn-helix transcriptional regulator [Metallosphaera tengchongensis]|uniref:Winged helix-turn-helix transcriptional regulator n=1 Tax=Metallosphaera tengchongensis TaxID=1532350 RepID=A0A6N0NWR8_9CREN|nr:helix-turn-helix domain-containing protein [Metallosphaera tengchongensis]QKQ99560.1 winged helix-turn-helix transcriptional regulator [Metallosphaera tengchongensis]